MKSRKCEVCGSTKRLARAHIIHDGMFDDKKNIMILCHKRHKAFDIKMDKLLNRPFYYEWQKKQQNEAQLEYRNKFVKVKSFCLTIESGVYSLLRIDYNTKTDHVYLYNTFRKSNYVNKHNRKTKSLFSSSFGEPYVYVRDCLYYNINNDNISIQSRFGLRGGN